MEFRLLGPIEAVRDGRSLPLGGPKQRAVLALLLLHANEVVSRDRLIEALWADREPGTAGAQPRRPGLAATQGIRAGRARCVTRARRLRPRGRARADRRAPLRGVARGRTGGRTPRANRPTRSRALEDALALWRGEALGDLAYEEFARTDVERLGGSAPRRSRGADRGRARARTPRPARPRARGTDGEASAARAAARAAHARALPVGAAGRGAAGVRGHAQAARRGARHRAGPAAYEISSRPSFVRTRRSTSPRTASETRRRRVLVGSSALVLAGAAVALFVGLTQGGTESAQALADPDSNVFLSAATGELVRAAPCPRHGSRRLRRRTRCGASRRRAISRGSIPRRGKEVATLGLGIKPSGACVGEGSVWVTDRNSPTLFRIDPTVNEDVERFPTPDEGVETHLTGEVAVGAGSVWVGHGAFNPGAWRRAPRPGNGRRAESLLDPRR